jgi:hypothetical protein
MTTPSTSHGGRPPFPAATPLWEFQLQNVPVSVRSVFCTEVGRETVAMQA